MFGTVRQGKSWAVICMLVIGMTASGCASFLPSSGPSSATVDQYDSPENGSGIQLVQLNTEVARKLIDSNERFKFSYIFTDCPKGGQYIGLGDVIEVTVWETPPATLFFNPSSDLGMSSGGMGPVRFPEQQVGSDGSITIPFAGHLEVVGKTLKQVEAMISDQLRGKANEPQIVARLVKNISSTCTVVGEVKQSQVVPLTPKCERLLDVLAEAGGVKEQVNKLTVQLTRQGKVHAVPLEMVIKEQAENVVVQPGDVITVLYQTNSFTALGATGRNTEIEFEATGITLAQALARSGGVVDERADAQGVFLFRFEPLDALDWPHQPPMVTPENTVPVIYKVDLRDPATFFAAQSFPIKDKDILFVANAPSVQLRKFLNMVSSITNPALSTAGQVRTLTPSAWD